MRRIVRLDRSIDLLRTRATALSPSTYLCSACKHHASPFSTSALRLARKNGKVPLSEKLRQKIWGTQHPPGQEDPYGDKSVFDQTKEREKEEEVGEREAARQASAPDMSTYEPATTWDGLERVGGFGGWWKQNWDPEHQFTGFVPKEVTTESEAITAALHRAMVEVFTLQEAGVPIDSISKSMPGQDLTMDVKFELEPTGPKLSFAESISREDIVQSLAPEVDETAEKTDPTESEEDVAADRSTVDPLHPESESAEVDETAVKENPTESEEDVAADRSSEDPLHNAHSMTVTYEELIASWGPAWLQVSLESPDIKFAVLKRMMQLTGIRIPDSALKSSKNAQALLKHLIVPPKPRKLVDALSQKEDLMTLPNVSVYAKRITPIDKEKSVGRWKVIEKELQERGLPVTGH